MNTPTAFPFWIEIFGTLALEAALVFLLAILLQQLARTAGWRRTVWQMALIGLGLMAILEITGGSRLASALMADWMKSNEPQAVPKRIVVIESANPITAIGSDQPQDRATDLQVTDVTASSTATLEARETRIHLPWWPGFIWLMGFTYVAGRAGFSRLLFFLLRQRKERRADPALMERVQLLARLLGLRRRVRVSCLPQLTSPVAYGVFCPSIGVPEGFSREFTLEQREAMLIHELAHLAARDPLWYLVADFVTGLLWWHPLAWWSRRRLQMESESSADEASLLLKNGPDALAESLVALGKRLAIPRSWSWLGVEGNGFRSGLGRRVERLCQISGRSWCPANRAGGWLARVIGPAVLAAVGLAGAAWALPLQKAGNNSNVAASWDRSVAGLALEALRSARKGTPDAPLSSQAPAEAQPTSLGVLAQPTIPVEQDKQDEAPAEIAAPQTSATPVVKDSATNEKASVSPREKLISKLDQIHFEQLRLDGVPLGEVTMLLTAEARRRDPERTGIDFMLNNAIDPASKEPGNIGATTIRINPGLTNVSLRQVLDAVIHAADRRLKYSIENYAVVFSPNNPDTSALVLHTRVFKVDPTTFFQALRSVQFAPNATAAATNSLPENPRAKSAPEKGQGASYRGSSIGREETISPKLLQDFFQAAGVNLAPPKSILFNERSGEVFVRATQDDLDVIEKAIQFLNTMPTQLTIDVKFCEIKEDDLSADFDRTLASILVTNAATGSAAGILPAQQFRSVLKALEKKSGVDILSSPRVTTLSGRQAQIKVVDVKYIVTDLDITTNYAQGATGSVVSTVIQPITEPMEFGPVFDVLPEVLTDGFTIRMRVMASIKEFLGYDKSTGFVASVRETDGNGRLKAPKTSSTTPLPKFRVRNVVTSAIVWDGQTLLLTGGSMVETVKTKNKVPLLGDLPIAGRLFQSETSKTIKKELLIFVTPSIIDPAGNRVHSDQDMPFAAKSAPPQSPPPPQDASKANQ